MKTNENHEVVQGRIVIEGIDLAEGTPVTVLVDDGAEGFTLSLEEEAEILESIAEADRGDSR
jgi:hypothetical protein